MKTNDYVLLSLIVLVLALMFAVPVKAQHYHDHYWDHGWYSHYQYDPYYDRTWPTYDNTYWHSYYRRDRYLYDPHWINQHRRYAYNTGIYRSDYYGQRYYYLEPVEYAEYDVNYIGLKGDITKFFKIDGQLAALVDNTWVFNYSEYWNSVIRVKEPAVVTGHPPFLIVPDKEVWRSVPSKEIRYAPSDQSYWDMVFEVPEHIRIYTGTTMLADSSLLEFQNSQNTREQNSQTDEPVKRDLLIAGERIVNETTSVGIMLIKPADSPNWLEIELIGEGTVRNLHANSSYAIFTQGTDIFALDAFNYEITPLYQPTRDPETITCMDTHTSFPTLAGTDGGHLIYSSSTREWERLKYNFRKPILEICGPYVISGDNIKNKLRRISWEPREDRLDPQEYQIDEIQLPAGFTPLSVIFEDGKFLCGGTNGQVLQLKKTPYREQWISTYHPYYYPYGNGVVVSSVRIYDHSVLADPETGKDFEQPPFDKYGREIPEPIEFPEPPDDEYLDPDPLPIENQKQMLVPGELPVNPVVIPRPVDSIVRDEEPATRIEPDYNPPPPEPNPAPAPKPQPVYEKPKPAPAPQPTPVRSEPAVKPAPKPVPKPVPPPPRPSPPPPKPVKQEQPKKEPPPKPSDKPKPKPKSSSSSK